MNGGHKCVYERMGMNEGKGWKEKGKGWVNKGRAHACKRVEAESAWVGRINQRKGSMNDVLYTGDR